MKRNISISSIRMDRNVPMPMRDGTILRSDIYRPDGKMKHPAIFLRTYINKERIAGSMLNSIDVAHAGYAVVIQDVRGMYASDGEWSSENSYALEGPDGYDSVEWIAAQSWCDGNVGTAGGSHMAHYQWLTAMEHPPHLKAMAPWYGDFNMGFTPPLSGGVIPLSTNLTVLPRQAVEVVNRLEREGKNVEQMRKIVNWARNNQEEFINFLPLKDLPVAQFEHTRQTLNRYFHPLSDVERERNRRYEKVMLPCFHVTGWYEGCQWNVFENFKKMRERGGSKLAREGQHLLVGPWMHGPTSTTLGEINFSPSAAGPGALVSECNVAFYDKYIRGENINIPIIRYFIMGRYEWREADTWPPPQAQWQRFYFHSSGSANSSAGNGILSRNEPSTSEPPDTFVYDPHNPVPTIGGPLVSGGGQGPGMVAGPFEQSYIEKRTDVLCYTTPEFKEDFEVTGPLELHLFASTTARDTDFTAKLIDVYPNGRAYNLAEGIKRASGRKFIEKPELINPGEIYEFVITMGHTSQLFRRGHRLRIDVTSSDFPQWDRNMNTGNPIGEDAHGIITTQTIYHHPDYASYIDLPVMPQ